MFTAHADVEPVEMFPGVSRRIRRRRSERTTLAEIALAAGSTVPEHSHHHEQIGYAVRGRVRFRIGSKSRELTAGDSYLVPSGVLHEVTALEDAVCIDIFSPVREEFL